MPMKGMKGEQRAANSLRRRGFNVTRSPGSRGAADLDARAGGRRWLVQVKSSRGPNPAWPASNEVRRLNSMASKNNATPIVAQVSPKGIEFFSARNRRRLRP